MKYAHNYNIILSSYEAKKFFHFILQFMVIKHNNKLYLHIQTYQILSQIIEYAEH